MPCTDPGDEDQGTGDTNGTPTCESPTAAPSRQPAGLILSGAAVDLDVVVTHPTGSGCISHDIAWFLCSTPSTSAQLPVGACTPIASRFVPDVRGSYRLEVRVSGGFSQVTESLEFVAEREPLFVQASFIDPAIYEQDAKSGASPGACAGFNAAGTCNAAVACTWDAEFGTCWINCASHASQLPCNDAGRGACFWNSTSCTPIAHGELACVQKAGRAACDTNVNCIWRPMLGQCRQKCSTFSTRRTCVAGFCQWNDGSKACGSSGGGGLVQAAVAFTHTDGSDFSIVRPATGSYVYDPNGLMAGEVDAVGTGGRPSFLGMSSAGSVVAMPVSYMFTAPHTTAGQPPVCRVASNMLLVDVSSGSGTTPASMVAILAPQANLATADEVFTAPEVLYPSVVAVGGGHRLALGVHQISRFTGCSNYLANGGVRAGWAVSSARQTSDLLPLASLRAAPIHTYDVNSAGVVSGGSLINGGAFACIENSDCLAGDCVGGACSTAFTVQAYLPRLLPGGTAMTLSHATCEVSASNDCVGPYDYDLLLTQISPGGVGFAVDKTILVAADPSVNELDAFVVGDVSAVGTSFDIVYLGIQLPPQELNARVVDAPMSVTITKPIHGIYRRRIEWTGQAWQPALTPTSAVAPLVQGRSALRQLTAPVPCGYTHVPNLRMDEGLRLINPAQLTVSADGRRAVYTETTQEADCRPPATDPDAGDVRAGLGPILSAQLKILDLQAGTGPRNLLPASCEAVLGPVSLSPKFIAQGNEILFSNQGANEQAVPKLYRFSLSRLDSAACTLVEVLDPQEMQNTLKAINPDLHALGARAVESQTLVRPNPLRCDVYSGLGLSWVAVVLWRLGRWRQRRPRA